MTTDELFLPLLRGRLLRSDAFINPSNALTDRPKPPERDPAQHRRALLESLDALAEAAEQRGARVPQATREIIAVEPSVGHKLVESPLGDKRTDVRIVSLDSETGTAIVDAPTLKLDALRRKIDEYADDEKLTAKGNRRNNPAVAPIESVHLAEFTDLVGDSLRRADLSEDEPRWFEVSCRGGTRNQDDIALSRTQISIALGNQHVAGRRIQEFLTAERVHFYLRLALRDFRRVIAMTDCVYEVDLVEPQLRRWLHLENQNAVDVRGFVLAPPPIDAPAIALLDTGVASEHPLLQPVIHAAVSAVPGELSTADTYGHGTNMAGIVTYGDDLSDALDDGFYAAPYWVESSRILVTPNQGSAADSERPYWPSTTQMAIERVEQAHPDRQRIFCMAVGASNGCAGAPTGWSVAIDGLAFDQRRLIVLAIGNADHDIETTAEYPRSQLRTSLLDPAQSINAITVGAYTKWVSLPPDGFHGQYAAVASAGQVSPHSRSGISKGVVKPDVVFEGGNLFSDGQIPTIADTASYLTTSHEVLAQPLGMIAGTSPAAAMAARFAARIWATNPGLAPETIRALMVHSASWTAEMLDQVDDIDERLALCGWGVPDLAMAERCAANRATVIYEGAIASRADADGAARAAHIFRLPLPDHLADVPGEAEVRVTLSYFPEPRRRRNDVSYGLGLRWDMQGPTESEELFLDRVNRASRPNHAKRRKQASSSFDWKVGRQRRSRGSLQSDRWIGPAAHLASSKLVAVYPVLGWWDKHGELGEEEMPYSLVVTVRTATDVDVYESVRTRLSVEVPAM